MARGAPEDSLSCSMQAYEEWRGKYREIKESTIDEPVGNKELGLAWSWSPGIVPS